MTTPKERPILFSAPMVRALLAGTKTQTRRVLRVQPPADTMQVSTWHHPDPRPHFFAWSGDPAEIVPDWSHPCPRGQPGDRLWVREHWATDSAHDAIPPREIPPAYAVRYLADGAVRGGLGQPDGKDRRAFHLPRWASRITLEVTGVRVERLQEISEADAVAEGVTPQWEPGCSGRLMEALGGFSYRPAASAYADLWEEINGPGSWDENPWVWVVGFKLLKGGE